MSRGGFRKGAGRKKEYQEPVQKILIGLPQSVLEKLDAYAKRHDLSRPKAIALLLESVPGDSRPKKQTDRKQLLNELRALKDSLNR